jgi:uncharacterized protein
VTEVLDADAHLLEGPRFLADHAPADLADDLLLRVPSGQAQPGATDPAGRGAVLDRFGLAGQLVLTTAAAPFVAHVPVPLRQEAARAHNRAITAWCAATSDSRVWPVAFVPLHDPVSAVEVAREAIGLGCRAVLVPSDPAAGPAPDDVALDRFWAEIASAGVPFVLHIATGGRLVPRGWAGTCGSDAEVSGGDGISAFELAVAHVGPQRFLTAMVLGGVLVRHPRLRGLCLEQGAGWVPPWLATLDGVHTAYSRAGMLRLLPEPPSVLARRALAFAPHPFERVDDLCRAAGTGLWVACTDWPHPEGGRDPYGRSTWQVSDDEARGAFVGRNLSRILSAT